MKGIVAELNKKYAVILTQDGTFRKIKAVSGMKIGNEIELNQPAGTMKVVKSISRISSIAAASLLALGIGYGAFCYTMPYSYIDVDINPSIELTANIFDRIIKAEAINEDGKKLLSCGNLKNARLEDGVARIITKAAEQGYLKAEPLIENAVLFTVSSEDGKKSNKLKAEVEEAANDELDKSKIKSEVLIGEASIKQRNDARELGVTPGKLVLIEDAIEENPELELEELKQAPVKELVKKARDRKAAEEKQKVEKSKEKDENTGSSSTDKNSSDVKAGQSASIQAAIPALKSEKQNEPDNNSKAGNDNNKTDSKNNNNKNNKNNSQNNGNKSVRNKANNKNSNAVIDEAALLERERREKEKLKDELLGLAKETGKNDEKEPLQKQSEKQNGNKNGAKEKNGKNNKQKG